MEKRSLLIPFFFSLRAGLGIVILVGVSTQVVYLKHKDNKARLGGELGLLAGAWALGMIWVGFLACMY